MKKSVKRQRRTEVLLLLVSLGVLSAVYVGLLSSSYRAYLNEQDEHTLTWEGNSSLPSVSSSLDDTSAADADSSDASGSSNAGTDTADENTDVAGSASADRTSAANSSDTAAGQNGDISSESDTDGSDSSTSGSDVTDNATGSSGEESAATYGRTVSGSAILLGDTDMLSIYSYDPADATVCTTSGISTANVLSSSFIVPEVSTKERTVEQILNLGDFDACYLFLGVHEAEWYYEDSFIEYYEALIAEIQELAPDTVIYIHAIPSVSVLAEAGVSTTATEEHIAKLNVKLKAMAAEYSGVVFVTL
ncbi:MAG: hypothetical protein LUE29_12760 [Lachnospiraceae bacterium]|nr:hypothetical protein [Lachnospiraceae bacterium]